MDIHLARLDTNYIGFKKYGVLLAKNLEPIIHGGRSKGMSSEKLVLKVRRKGAFWHFLVSLFWHSKWEGGDFYHSSLEIYVKPQKLLLAKC